MSRESWKTTVTIKGNLMTIAFTTTNQPGFHSNLKQRAEFQSVLVKTRVTMDQNA